MTDPLLQFEAAVSELRDAAEAGLELIARGHPMQPHERKLIEDTARFIREYDAAKATEAGQWPPVRPCTDCANAPGQIRTPATFIIYEADGLARFACDAHQAAHAGRSEPIAEFWKRVGSGED